MFRIRPSLSIFPVIHESGDYALKVREMILSGDFDCLAVALPASFEEGILQGIDRFPEVSAVLQREPGETGSVNYVPVDPCQGMIMGIRIALQEYLPCEFIDREVDAYDSSSTVEK